MEEEKKLQEKENEKVTGGSEELHEVSCANCNTRFVPLYQECKNISSGCVEDRVYKCPGCDKWVYADGGVYEE